MPIHQLNNDHSDLSKQDFTQSNDQKNDNFETEPNQGEPVDHRKVKGARMIRKVLQPDGTYDELWIYYCGSEHEFSLTEKIRQKILQDTDIDLQFGKSEDDKQSCKFWRRGNVEFLEIFGLPS